MDAVYMNSSVQKKKNVKRNGNAKASITDPQQFTFRAQKAV